MRRFQGKRVFADANLLIYFLDATSQYFDSAAAFVRGVADGSWVCVVNELVSSEVMVGFYRHAGPAEVKRAREFLFGSALFETAPLTRDALQRAALLRARTSTRLIDSVHVATAMASGCDALLTNDKRMTSVQGLEVVQLSDLQQV